MDKREIGYVSLLSGYFIVYLHRVVISVIKPDLEALAQSHGIDPFCLSSMVASAYFYSYAAMQIPGGVLADVVGIRKYATISMVAMALGTAMFAIDDPYLMVVSRIIIGASAAAIFISVQRYIGVKYSANLGARLTGLALLVGSVGAIVATYPIRVLSNSLGWKLVFILLAGITLVVVPVMLLIDDRGLSSKTNLIDGFRKVLNQLKYVARSPHSWFLGYIFFALYGSLMAFHGYWGQQYYMDVGNLDKTAASLYLLVISVTFTITALPAGYLSDVILRRRRPVLFAFTLLTFITWLTLFLMTLKSSHTDQMILYLSAVLAGSALGFNIVIGPMARELYPTEYSGTTFSFVNIFAFAGGAIYSVLPTILGGLNSTIIFCLVTSLLAMAMSFGVKETLNH